MTCINAFQCFYKSVIETLLFCEVIIITFCSFFKYKIIKLRKIFILGDRERGVIQSVLI